MNFFFFFFGADGNCWRTSWPNPSPWPTIYTLSLYLVYDATPKSHDTRVHTVTVAMRTLKIRGLKIYGPKVISSLPQDIFFVCHIASSLNHSILIKKCPQNRTYSFIKLFLRYTKICKIGFRV